LILIQFDVTAKLNVQGKRGTPPVGLFHQLIILMTEAARATSRSEVCETFRDAKAELNRRSRGSVITLAVTGFRVAKMKNPET
jgi:hypothetical protein